MPFSALFVCLRNATHITDVTVKASTHVRACIRVASPRLVDAPAADLLFRRIQLRARREARCRVCLSDILTVSVFEPQPTRRLRQFDLREQREARSFARSFCNESSSRTAGSLRLNKASVNCPRVKLRIASKKYI